MLMFSGLQLRAQNTTTTEPHPATKTASKSSASRANSRVAAVKEFRIVQEKEGQALEILSTKPLVPLIQAISDPYRVVIDLPNARVDTPEKKIIVQADQITSIRADQFQQSPPIARIVVDLLAPRTFTWDAAGNRLIVHLGKSLTDGKASPFESAGVPNLKASPQPTVSVVRAPGPLAFAGENGTAASSITAGPDTAILRLSSGGEMHVCPGTTVAVTPSQNRHNVMFSMNTGALEAHFGLDASSDTIMTPDFRILLVGPGQFHYAISADNQGNTCVRALPGNTASAIVSELLGDRTYQVKATDQLVFRSGQLDRVDRSVPLECGCPPQREAPLRTMNNLPTQNDVQSKPDNQPRSASLAPAEKTVPAAALPAAVPQTPLNASGTPNELHVEVEAPLVYHAPVTPPAPVAEVSALPVDSRASGQPGAVAALPPAQAKLPDTDTATTKPAPPRGLLRKIGGFFSSLFH
jgi:hypothetical protein